MRRLESSPLLYKVLPQEDADQLYHIHPDIPRSGRVGCPSCGKNRGIIVDGTVKIGEEEFVCNCADQVQRYKHYLDAGIGLNYQCLTWGDFVGDQQAKAKCSEYVHNISQNVEAGCSLVIGSGREGSSLHGTGKTMLGTLVLKSCIMAGYRCFMTTYADMLSSLKAGWKDADYAKWYKGRIDSAQVLLIDDVGKELMSGSGFNNDFSKQTLDSLFRTRVQQSRPTIFTTNFDVGTMTRCYGEAFMSLLRENSVVVSVVGDDFRPLKQSRLVGERRIY